MSKQQALAFLSHAAETPELQQRLSELKGRDALSDLVRIAGESGFRFSEEDYRDAIVELAEGELDDDALREVQREMGL